MRTVTKTYQVYQFKELPERVKEKVIDNTIKSFTEYYDYNNLSPAMKKAVEKAENMKTPWFIGSYIWEYAKDEILSECKAFDYLEDGTIFNEDK